MSQRSLRSTPTKQQQHNLHPQTLQDNTNCMPTVVTQAVNTTTVVTVESGNLAEHENLKSSSQVPTQTRSIVIDGDDADARANAVRKKEEEEEEEEEEEGLTKNEDSVVPSAAADAPSSLKKSKDSKEEKVEGEAKSELNFMCDSDDELTEEQKKIIQEKIRSLQNAFKRFEEKSKQQKIEEICKNAVELGITELEADMILRVCNGNELEAEERLRKTNDLYQDVDETVEQYLEKIRETETGEFVMQIRDMAKEEYLAQKTQKGRMRKISEQRIQRKVKRLSAHKTFDEDGNEIVDSDLEAWEEYDNEQFFEEGWEEPAPAAAQAKPTATAAPAMAIGDDGKALVLDGNELSVKFVRHEKKTKGEHTGPRLKLDDAVAKANAVMEAQMKAREEKKKAKEAKKLAALKASDENAGNDANNTIASSADEVEAKDVVDVAVPMDATATTTTTPDETAAVFATTAIKSDENPSSAKAKATELFTEFKMEQKMIDSGNSDSDSDDEAPLEIDEAELFAGWSGARIKGWKNRIKNPNAYYYRFNHPGEMQSNGGWTAEEHELFMATLAKLPDGKATYEWGTFSIDIPGRVGYQCSNYYRSLVKSGIIVDVNYVVDDNGQLKFNFKNKGFERKEGDTAAEPKPYMPKVPKPPKPPRPPKAPKARPPPKIKIPKAKKPKKDEKKKKKKGEGDDGDDVKGDKTFRCSVKTTEIRRSSRNSAKEKKKYNLDGETDDDGEERDEEDDEKDEPPVLPTGFLDPITRMQIEEPAAISPYGHVAGYETWCRILRNAEAPDTCPFTKQPLKRRQLVKLTHANIAEYITKMVDVQQM